MRIAAVVEALVKAGATPEMILCAVQAAEGESDERRAEKRELARIRQQNHRSRNAASRVTERDKRDLLSPGGSSPTPPSPKPQSSIPPSPPKGGSSPAGFADFWAIFPNRVGKRDAEHAFVKAMHRADLETILTGLRRYAAKTDDRPWCNPATFLNQDRWADQPADVVSQHRSHAPPQRSMNDALDDLVNGKPPNEHPGPTIDASFSRADFGGAQGVVQFDAFAARQRS